MINKTKKELAEYRGCFIRKTRRLFRCTGINLNPKLLEIVR